MIAALDPSISSAFAGTPKPTQPEVVVPTEERSPTRRRLALVPLGMTAVWISRLWGEVTDTLARLVKFSVASPIVNWQDVVVAGAAVGPAAASLRMGTSPAAGAFGMNGQTLTDCFEDVSTLSYKEDPNKKSEIIKNVPAPIP